MKNLFVVCFMLAATGIFPTITFRAQAETPFSCDPGPGSLPSNDPKYPANQLILVCKPANWNGRFNRLRTWGCSCTGTSGSPAR